MKDFPQDLSLTPANSATTEGVVEKCRICGDRALGSNFQVLTCDSCRSFFRRASSNGKKLPTCPFNRDCAITPVSRRFCQGCRYQKCIREGMRHEGLKAENRIKVEAMDGMSPTGAEGSPRSKKQRLIPASPVKAKCTCRCQCGFYEQNVELVASSPLSTVHSPQTTFEEPKREVLTFNDSYLLNELIRANEVLKAPMELTLQELDSTEVSLLTVVRISDLAMRRIVSMAKLLSSFRRLDNHDQIALLKVALPELLILRGLMVFDSNKGAWNHDIYSGSRFISLHVDVLKNTPAVEHYEIHKQFLSSFDERWRQNENVMLILNAIVLFAPARPNLRDVPLVRQTQQLYVNLLERYLRTECSAEDAMNAYRNLMGKLEELREVNRSLQRVYTLLNPSDLDPLLRELFAHK
ncbi:hypothetical protein M3Y99_01997800 [Aphelenchoides fujianensis]|nr:hypothetical protein M3Y99_01997800 [Aphelenchoides fujianensis]